MKYTRNKREHRSPIDGIIKKLRILHHSLHIDSESVWKGVICGAFIILFMLLQTTIFTRVPPFGAVPDMMLSLVVAISISEGEKWGAVCGLISAYLIESLGSTGLTLLPLLYMPAGYICGILARYYLIDSVPVRAVYIAACGTARAVFTMIYITSLLKGYTLPSVIIHIIIPEFFSTALLAAFIHPLIWITLKPFHKTRAERTKIL